MMPSTVICQLMQEYDFHGPAMNVSAMCASANAAMITAKSWIDTGICSDVVLLATDLSGLPRNLRGFSDVGVAVLDTPPFDACRPFQEGSRGFVGGEAAVAMVLSGDPTGARAGVRGGAMTMDAYNVVSMTPDLDELFRCFHEALGASGVDPSEIAYMNAHGPGTAQCDAAEGRILDELFPEAHGIFSVKPLVGHCQAAAAAVETLATLYAFEKGSVPSPPQVAPGHPRLLDGLTASARADGQVVHRDGRVQLGHRHRRTGGLTARRGSTPAGHRRTQARRHVRRYQSPMVTTSGFEDVGPRSTAPNPRRRYSANGPPSSRRRSTSWTRACLRPPGCSNPGPTR